MQSPITGTTHAGSSRLIRLARAAVLGATFALLALSSAQAQPLTDSHRAVDLPAGHAAHSSWELVKEGHRYRLMLADGLIAEASTPVERRHRYYA